MTYHVATSVARIHLLVHVACAPGQPDRELCQELLDLQELFDVGVPEEARSCSVLHSAALEIRAEMEKRRDERHGLSELR